MTNLIKTSARIFGGSCVAGMGFSFGRDIYRKAKQARGLFVALFFLGLTFLGNYTSGVWLARNYRTVTEAVLKRVGALLVLAPSFAVLALTVSFFDQAFKNTSSVSTEQIQFEADELPPRQPSKPPVDEPIQAELPLTPTGVVVPLSMVFIGFFVGSLQRRKRQQVWDAEDHNMLFMEEHDLVEHEDSTIEDMSTGQNYRIDNVGSKRITLLALGRRGKRAYINIDETGKYCDYTGLVAL